MTDLLTISSQRLQLLLAPALGGSIARLDWMQGADRIPVLRGHDSPLQVLDTASFPLVPYCNRIRDGRFCFRGRSVELAPNMAGDPSPLHGQGWMARWEVIATRSNGAELRFAHAAGEWPWAYEARQSFALDEDRLTVKLTCRNASAEPMPCGLGHHPYFPCTGQTRLRTTVTHVWTVDELVLPVEKLPAAGRYDLSDRLVCGQGLDNGFGGWGGSALLSAPALPFSVEMSSPEARFFQLYSPATGEYVAAEPVGNANAALNAPEESWAEFGLRVLEPNEEMALTMVIRVNNRA